MIIVNSYTSFPAPVDPGPQGTAPFALDGLSAATLSASRCLFNCKRVLNTYTGYIIRLGNSSGTTFADFYADNNGNLLSSNNQTLSEWLTSSSVASPPFVFTWYDQSGLGNHATAIVGEAPTYDATNKRIDFTANSGLSRMAISNNPIPSGDSPYTFTLKHGQALGAGTNTSYPAFVGAGTYQALTYKNLVVGAQIAAGNTKYVSYWLPDYYENMTANGTLATNNIVQFKYNGNSGEMYIYVNNSTVGGATLNTLPPARQTTATNNYLGYGESQRNNYLNGQLYFVSIQNIFLPAGFAAGSDALILGSQ